MSPSSSAASDWRMSKLRNINEPLRWSLTRVAAPRWPASAARSGYRARSRRALSPTARVSCTSSQVSATSFSRPLQWRPEPRFGQTRVVAQLVERLALTQDVASSSLAFPAGSPAVVHRISRQPSATVVTMTNTATTTAEIELWLGGLAPPIREQLSEQGIEADEDDCQRWEDHRLACNRLCDHGLISPTEQLAIRHRLVRSILFGITPASALSGANNILPMRHI